MYCLDGLALKRAVSPDSESGTVANCKESQQMAAKGKEHTTTKAGVWYSDQ